MFRKQKWMKLYLGDNNSKNIFRKHKIKNIFIKQKWIKIYLGNNKVKTYLKNKK